jgi:hypothetical protein
MQFGVEVLFSMPERYEKKGKTGAVIVQSHVRAQISHKWVICPFFVVGVVEEAYEHGHQTPKMTRPR